MPANQIVDVDVHADLRILLQIADMRMVLVGRAVDEVQFALAQQHGGIADRRIFSDAALETRRAVRR